MANQYHLGILGEGVERWNRWRAANHSIQPDLSSADLTGMELENIDLAGANLSHANLSNTNLTRALLISATLEGADLSGANFSQAYLRSAHLHDATFFRTNFTEAFFEGAEFGLAKALEPIRTENSTIFSFAVETRFTECNFSQAVLPYAYLNDVVFTRTNLEGAILEFANLSRASLVDANLAHARLGNARIVGANLEGAVLTDTQLHHADLSNTNLTRANLTGAHLHRVVAREAVFQAAIFTNAICTDSDLTSSNFANANLSGIVLTGSNLSRTTLVSADLESANLSGCVLLETNFSQAKLRNCTIYGISAWNIDLTGAEQASLIITRGNEPTITVDDLEVAQFIYLLLNREKIRNVINTITSKAVLILGRFTPERKAVLDAMADELRKYNLLPIIFDFERATSRDFTETIKTLAGLSLFVIADITNPKSIPLELQATVPNYMIPFVPILQEGEEPFAMFKDVQNTFDWVLDTLIYDTEANLVTGFEGAIIRPALAKRDELLVRKAEELRTRHIRDIPNDG